MIFDKFWKVLGIKNLVSTN